MQQLIPRRARVIRGGRGLAFSLSLGNAAPETPLPIQVNNSSELPSTSNSVLADPQGLGSEVGARIVRPHGGKHGPFKPRKYCGSRTARRRTKLDQAESKSCAEPIRMKLPEPTPAALNEELPDSPIASAARALPAGARLDEFEVEEIIGEGSVAIVYAATDRALAVPVAIAEYMPARLAQRDDEAQVTPRTSAQADAFAKGLKAFINETRTLARCDHPSLVRIVRLCEANSTAYRVMPRYPARRLLEVRQGMNEPPDEEALRALLDALLGALLAFHHAGGCHGKVTPSNILLLADNRPLLLGPGAAGRAIASDRIDALMTSVEPCFAPIEQIVEADIPLHPSVDLYALAGVARYWMSGQLPAPAFGAPSTARREKLADTVQRLCLTWPRLHYSASLLDALDSALSIYPAERPQSVAQMRARLDTAPPTAGGPVSAPWTAAPVPNEAAAIVAGASPAARAAGPCGARSRCRDGVRARSRPPGNFRRCSHR